MPCCRADRRHVRAFTAAQRSLLGRLCPNQTGGRLVRPRPRGAPYLPTMTETVPEPARPQDAAALLELRNEAARWQHAVGIVQWRENEVPAKVYAEQAARGEWYVVRDGQRISGGLRLLWEDRAVWGEQPPIAVYVHHLVSRRSPAYAGLGASMLTWAAARAADNDRALVRLDCMESNQQLRAYYRGQGFTEVGRTVFDAESGWWPVTRFERSAQPA